MTNEKKGSGKSFSAHDEAIAAATGSGGGGSGDRIAETIFTTESPAVANASLRIAAAASLLADLRKNFEVGSASDEQCEKIKAKLGEAVDFLTA